MVLKQFLRAIVLALALIPVLEQASAENRGGKTILVTRTGWHSGIIIARHDLPDGVIPEAADFPDAAYYEFGWGHAKYYPLRKKTIRMMLGGVLPSRAVIHVVGLPRHPSEVFPDHEFIALRVTEGGFQRLVAYLRSSFERSGAGRAKVSAPGHHAFSNFYPATGTFHLFNTCNIWTARGLAAAGLQVRVSGAQQAEGLMQQLRALSRAATRAER